MNRFSIKSSDNTSFEKIRLREIDIVPRSPKVTAQSPCIVEYLCNVMLSIARE